MADVVRANTDDLGSFVEAGGRQATEIEALADRVSSTRSRVAGLVGDGPLGLATDRAVEDLWNRLVVANTFVETVRDALVAFETDDHPIVALHTEVIDAALGEIGWPATAVMSNARADRLVDTLDPDGLADDSDVVATGRAFADIVADIDRGDDLGMSNGELNQVRDRLADLDGDQVETVFVHLSRQQLDRLFHNVHSSGFWSNDWNDRERTEFYALLEPLSVETRRLAGRSSPYLDAWSDAQEATTGNAAAEAALLDLIATSGFSGELGFDEREAVLRQAANYPSTVAVSNLDRLTDQGFFADMDAEDQQRSAKLVGFLSEYTGGDRLIIDNTLELFLGDDAPYRFDWEAEDGTYGSARGEEFHFSRLYLDAGHDPVSSSTPAGASTTGTIHMVTHTVAHEVNHLVNGDAVSSSFEYFMGEYRAFYVGHVAQYGTTPTRADVAGRVDTLLTARTGAYRRIADALDDPVEGPLIAAFVEGVVGRPVTAADVVDELADPVTDPTVAAPTPVGVDGGPNNLDNDPTRTVP